MFERTKTWCRRRSSARTTTSCLISVSSSGDRILPRSSARVRSRRVSSTVAMRLTVARKSETALISPFARSLVTVGARVARTGAVVKSMLRSLVYNQAFSVRPRMAPRMTLCPLTRLLAVRT